jgi:transcriptional regulator with XRE-family HTH domain
MISDGRRVLVFIGGVALVPHVGSGFEARMLAAKTCFGRRLRTARQGKFSQRELGTKVNLTRVMIANYESGKAAPDSEKAMQLAGIVGEAPAAYIFLANLQRVANRPNVSSAAFEAACQVIQEYRVRAGPGRVTGASTTHLSLVDWPRAFRPLTVIVGDKREEDPLNLALGDLFVFSASTVDDRWIFKLGLPRDTEKICDKAVVNAIAEDDTAWLDEHLRNRHLLLIGSPASNLCARKWNKHFLFRFAVSEVTEEKWKWIERDISKVRTAAELASKRDRLKVDLKQTMRMYKMPGFVAFNYKHLKLGIDPSFTRDFGVVSLGLNPYAAGAPYFAILAAGVHHPGTAYAVRQLADPSNFMRHPFGGILEVNVPSPRYVPEEIRWHNKIEKSDSAWHTAGDDPLEYTPETLRAGLESHLREFDRIKTDAAIDKDEIQEHIELIDLLESAKAGEA